VNASRRGSAETIDKNDRWTLEELVAEASKLTPA
jgi:hypothetical protein